MTPLILLVLAFLALYLWLISPRIFQRPAWEQMLGVYYAHRGLHDNASDVPENSMAAFQKAVEGGYGIELDVQLTKDRVPVVFHDESLKRVCGVEGNVRDYTFEQLQQFPLCGSAERIPKFSDVLDLVRGKVPLIVEIKIHEDVDAVCSRADGLLQAYQGPYCVESFHPMAMKWYRHHRSGQLRGQLSTDFSKPGKPERLPQILVHYLLTNVMARPDFIAYNCRHRHNISRLVCKGLFHPLNVTWTVKSQQELDECREDFDIFIFEGFIPR